VPLSVDEPCRDMVPVGGRLVPADRCAFLSTRAAWRRPWWAAGIRPLGVWGWSTRGL